MAASSPFTLEPAPAAPRFPSRTASATRAWVVAIALGLLMGGAWARSVVKYRQKSGFFVLLGVDFGHYWAQARVLRDGPPAAIYDSERALVRRDQLVRANGSKWRRVHHQSLTPYPGLFARVFTLFTLGPPPLAFALWSLLNLAIVLRMAHRAAPLFPRAQIPYVYLVFAIAYPIAISLFLGQIQVLIAWSMGEAFLAFREGKERKAGLWLGVLAFKPHYAALLGLVLLLTRRRQALLWALMSGAAIWLSSLVSVGPAALRAYPQAVLAMARWDPGDVPLMINWRKVVFFGWPGIQPETSTALDFILGLVTAGVAIGPWLRGGFRPRDPDFPARFALLLSATLLINSCMYPYGAAILALPLAAVWREARYRHTRPLVVALAIVPTLLFTLVDFAPPGADFLDLQGAGHWVTFLHLALFFALIREAYPVPTTPIATG